MLCCVFYTFGSKASRGAIAPTARHLYDTDLVAELQYDLPDNPLRAQDVYPHARNRAVFRRPDVESLDVVASSGNQADDPREDARLVLDISVETVYLLFHASASLSTTTSTRVGRRDLVALEIAASSLAPSETRTPRMP